LALVVQQFGGRYIVLGGKFESSSDWARVLAVQPEASWGAVEESPGHGLVVVEGRYPVGTGHQRKIDESLWHADLEHKIGHAGVAGFGSFVHRRDASCRRGGYSRSR
jgi:hypothetical protein